MSVEVSSNPYFALINREGPVLASNVDRFADYAWPCIDQLMREGRVFSQRFMFRDDSLLFYIGKPVSETAVQSPSTLVLGRRNNPWKRSP